MGPSIHSSFCIAPDESDELPSLKPPPLRDEMKEFVKIKPPDEPQSHPRPASASRAPPHLPVGHAPVSPPRIHASVPALHNSDPHTRPAGTLPMTPRSAAPLIAASGSGQSPLQGGVSVHSRRETPLVRPSTNTMREERARTGPWACRGVGVGVRAQSWRRAAPREGRFWPGATSGDPWFGDSISSISGSPPLRRLPLKAAFTLSSTWSATPSSFSWSFSCSLATAVPNAPTFSARPWTLAFVAVAVAAATVAAAVACSAVARSLDTSADMNAIFSSATARSVSALALSSCILAICSLRISDALDAPSKVSPPMWFLYTAIASSTSSTTQTLRFSPSNSNSCGLPSLASFESCLTFMRAAAALAMSTVMVIAMNLPRTARCGRGGECTAVPSILSITAAATPDSGLYSDSRTPATKIVTFSGTFTSVQSASFAPLYMTSIFTRVAKSCCSGRTTLKCCRRPYSVSASASSMSAISSTDTLVPRRQSSLWLAKSSRASSGSNDSFPLAPPAAPASIAATASRMTAVRSFLLFMMAPTQLLAVPIWISRTSFGNGPHLSNLPTPTCARGRTAWYACQSLPCGRRACTMPYVPTTVERSICADAASIARASFHPSIPTGFRKATTARGSRLSLFTSLLSSATAAAAAAAARAAAACAVCRDDGSWALCRCLSRGSPPTGGRCSPGGCCSLCPPPPSAPAPAAAAAARPAASRAAASSTISRALWAAAAASAAPFTSSIASLSLSLFITVVDSRLCRREDLFFTSDGALRDIEITLERVNV